MTKPYRIFCTTSDKYLPAIRPFAHLLKRYWPDHPEVVVIGFTTPDFPQPERFKFLSVGSFADYPIGRWSDALIKALHILEDEVFILMLDDYWVDRPVYGEVVDMAHAYMEQFRYVARLDLTGDRAGAEGGNVSLYGKLGHVDLIWSNPDSAYHCSLMTAFWRKEHLLKVLIPGESPWDVELQGTPRLAARRDEMIVVGTNAWPIHHGLAFRGGEMAELDTGFLDEETVAEMTAEGLLDPWLKENI